VALDVYASDGNNGYQSDASTDANGNYVLGVVGYGAGDSWQAQANGSDQLTNYVFSQPAWDQNGGTNINAGQAVHQNFTGILATNYITGTVKFNGTNVIGVGVSAFAIIGGVNYSQNNVDTAANGIYLLNVVNTNTWSVNVSAEGGDDSLDNILGNGNYQPPLNQNVVINNNTGTANFIVLPASGSGQIFGYVTDTDSNPVTGVNVYANDGIGDNFINTTDGSGYYSFSLADGSWDVSVDCGGLNSLGYQCVSDQGVTVSDNDVEQDFVVQANNPQPVLNTSSWHANNFQMMIAGVANQNYTVQMATNLNGANWMTLYITNNPVTGSFLLTDPNATNHQRFYRILVGP